MEISDEFMDAWSQSVGDLYRTAKESPGGIAYVAFKVGKNGAIALCADERCAHSVLSIFAMSALVNDGVDWDAIPLHAWLELAGKAGQMLSMTKSSGTSIATALISVEPRSQMMLRSICKLPG